MSKCKQVKWRGKYYNSYSELARTLGLDVSAISHHMKRSGNLDSLGLYGDKTASKYFGVVKNHKKVVDISAFKIKVECLDCGYTKWVCKSGIKKYLDRNGCSRCKKDKRIVHTDIIYKGVKYYNIRDLSLATGINGGTIRFYLNHNKNLDDIKVRSI